jgi:hypothetical protein
MSDRHEGQLPARHRSGLNARWTVIGCHGGHELKVAETGAACNGNGACLPALGLGLVLFR